MGVWLRQGLRLGGRRQLWGQLGAFCTCSRKRSGEAGLARQDGRRSREERIRCPSLDSVPEAVHAPKRGVVRGEEVCSVRQNRE